MIQKPFEKELYNNYDFRAKNALREHLMSEGFNVDIPKENYGIDIIADNKYYHEVEVKLGWKRGWPKSWTTVQIPFRKAKLFNNYPINNLLFWVLSEDVSKGWKIQANKLENKYVKAIENIKIEEGERFFCVPLNLCELIYFDKNNYRSFTLI